MTGSAGAMQRRSPPPFPLQFAETKEERYKGADGDEQRQERGGVIGGVWIGGFRPRSLVLLVAFVIRLFRSLVLFIVGGNVAPTITLRRLRWLDDRMGWGARGKEGS